MPDQRHSAYRRLGTARTNLIRSQADVRDIGIESQFSSISSQMNLQDISNKSEAIAGTLNLISAGAGLAMEYGKTEKAIGELETITGEKAEKTYGETPLGDLFKRQKPISNVIKFDEWSKMNPGKGYGDYSKSVIAGKDRTSEVGGIFTKEGWREAGERLSVLSGMEDPRYQFKGAEYTSSQLEAALPFVKMGKKFDEFTSMISPFVSSGTTDDLMDRWSQKISSRSSGARPYTMK